MPVSAREAALKALTKVRRNGAWTDAALNSILLRENLDERDAALTARIFYGVVQNLALCDYYISSFSTVRTSKMEPQILDILRLCVYQLVFMSKIPVNAAVYEGVELAKKYANPRAVGLVNAILRKIAGQLPDQLPAVTGATPTERLSVRYSHPAWLVDAFVDRLGAEGAEALLQANNADAVISARVNTLKTDAQTLITALRQEQVDAAIHPWLPDCLQLTNARSIDRLSTFKEGLFYVQDPAAALAVTAAGARPGMLVIDACAAPGGKSFAAAIDMRDRGRIISCDINENKLRRVTESAQRMGLKSIETRVMDARVINAELMGTADIVLADVPCSGFGVIRKKPEIRYKPEKETMKLPELQLQIIDSLSGYVKPGGQLLYSTCTLLQRENEDIVTAFLSKHSDFSPEPFQLPDPIGNLKTGMTTLWPHTHGTDGFFICRLRKTSSMPYNG
jgi:16S rRNA (cytosine967-C5)-methyltransferase